MSQITDLKAQVAAAACFSCVPSDTAQAIKTYLLAVIAGGSLDPKTLLAQSSGFFAIPSGVIPAVQATLAATLAGSSVPALVAQSNCAAVCLTTATALTIQLLNLAKKAGGSIDPKTLAKLSACFVCIPTGLQGAVQAFLMAVAAGVVPAPPPVPAGSTPTGPATPVPPSLLRTAFKAFAYPPNVVQLILGDAIAVWQSSFNVPAPTGFTYTIAADGSIDTASWNVPPSGVISTQLWTSSDGITFTLESTIAAPDTTTTSPAPATGVVKYAQIRWCNPSVCGPFSSVQSVTGTYVLTNSWVTRVLANGGAMPSANTISASQTFEAAISSLKSRIYHLNFVAPDSLIAFQTPFIKTVGIDPWVRHSVGVPVIESLTVQGYNGCSTGRANGYVYDTGVIPSNIANFNTGNCGLCVYVSTVGTTNQITNACIGGYDGTSAFELLPDVAGSNVVEGIGFDAANITSTAADHQGGFFMTCRVSTTDLRTYRGSSVSPWAQLGATQAAANATTPMTTTCYAAGDLYPGAVIHGANVYHSFFAILDGFSSADGQKLFNAVQALRTSLGGGFV